MPALQDPYHTSHYGEGKRYDVTYSTELGRVKIINVYAGDVRLRLSDLSDERFRAITRECESDRAARELDMMHLLKSQLPKEPVVLNRLPLRWQ